LKFLLDTNACIAIIKNDPPGVRARLSKAISEASEIYYPSIAAFELWYGVFKSAHRDQNEEALRAFLSGPVEALPFTDDDAKAAGELRTQLEREGKPIGAYDLLIAAQALRGGMTLVTANSREFARVRHLKWRDWRR
jgi:tRNA(fMet)-specific endonuclease VapC